MRSAFCVADKPEPFEIREHRVGMNQIDGQGWHALAGRVDSEIHPDLVPTDPVESFRPRATPITGIGAAI